MTRLYDVISAQPSVDAGQICQNSFCLAMALGDNRHYRIDTILPGHFVQTARSANVGESGAAKVSPVCGNDRA
jgi:serine/threonine-protein kinase HipA